MRRSPAALALSSAISLLLLGACSSEPLSGSEGQGPPSALAAADYPGRLAEILCGARELGVDAESCVNELAATYETRVEATLELDVRFDEQAAARCVASLAERVEDCRYLGTELSTAPCDGVFAGLLGPGAACESELECERDEAGPAFCDSALEGGVGVCAPRIAEGDACFGPGCGDGLYCDLFTATCQPQQTSGQCDLVTACAPDFACSPDAECVAKLLDGEPCQLDLQCEGGVCDLGGTCARTFASDLVCVAGAL